MLAERIADSFSKEGIISDEDKEVVRFGLESLEGNLLGIILTLGVGIAFHHVADALILWLLLFPMRKNVGGFHANTKIGCFLISAGMLLITFTLFMVFDHSTIFYVVCGIVAGGIIWVWAPVDNLSKRLDEMEHKVYQRRSRIVLGIDVAILVLALKLDWQIMIRSVLMTFFMVGISLLLGVIKLRKYYK